MDFIYQLVNRGDLSLAKVLRAKCIEKMEQREAASHASHILLPSISVTIKQSSLIDFKSEHLAEQMTLLDSKLFLKIEVIF
jgi:Rap guanine nucleotide exchange factor 1